MELTIRVQYQRQHFLCDIDSDLWYARLTETLQCAMLTMTFHTQYQQQQFMYNVNGEASTWRRDSRKEGRNEH